MKPRINLITLGVRDLEAATHFYEQGLGFPRLPGIEGPVSFFTLAGTWLALFGREDLAKDAAMSSEGTGFAGITLAHNCASKEEVDAVMQVALAAGAKQIKPPQDATWGGYSGYFADLDGHLWEVAWNPGFWPGPPEA